MMVERSSGCWHRAAPAV